jgi:hypothetical protein
VPAFCVRWAPQRAVIAVRGDDRRVGAHALEGRRIVILIATRDWLYALLMCGIVFLGFWLYEVMYPKKLGQ